MTESIKIKIGFWQIFSIVGVVATSLQTASADGKITITEAIGIVKAICEKLGINFDTTGFDASILNKLNLTEPSSEV